MKTKNKKIVVSFSGGETSAYMCHYLLQTKAQKDLIFVFANTGEEDEKTLEFVHRVDYALGLNLNWVEYADNDEKFKVVDYDTAYRSYNEEERANGYANHPFAKIIQQYGIPNLESFHCTRELKERPLRRFLKNFGLQPKDYLIAIGIRSDEVDRMGKHYYPLVEAGITKNHINRFWSEQPFRLNLSSYRGNCRTCWKKSIRSLHGVNKEDPKAFDFFRAMEKQYSDYLPSTHSRSKPVLFYPKHRKVDEILSIDGVKPPIDKNKETATQEDLFVKAQIEDYQVILWNDEDRETGCSAHCEAFI